MEVPGFFEALDEVLKRFVLEADEDTVIDELHQYVAEKREKVGELGIQGGLVIGQKSDFKKDPAYLAGMDDFHAGQPLFSPRAFHKGDQGVTDAYLYAVGWMQGRFELFKDGEYDANEKLIEIRNIIDRSIRKVDWTRPGPNSVGSTSGGGNHPGAEDVREGPGHEG